MNTETIELAPGAAKAVEKVAKKAAKRIQASEKARKAKANRSARVKDEPAPPPMSAKKAAAKKGKAIKPKPGSAKLDPTVAKLQKDLETSKKRLASKPKPAPAKGPAKKRPAKREPKPNTYKAMAASRTGASSIEHPVQAMWNLCDKMQKEPRKKVIEAAVDMGISYYTARTQYQLWLSAFRNS